MKQESEKSLNNNKRLNNIFNVTHYLKPTTTEQTIKSEINFTINNSKSKKYDVPNSSIGRTITSEMTNNSANNFNSNPSLNTNVLAEDILTFTILSSSDQLINTCVNENNIDKNLELITRMIVSKLFSKCDINGIFKEILDNCSMSFLADDIKASSVHCGNSNNNVGKKVNNCPHKNMVHYAKVIILSIKYYLELV